MNRQPPHDSPEGRLIIAATIEVIEVMLGTHCAMARTAAELSVVIAEWRGDKIAADAATLQFAALRGDLVALAEQICELNRRFLDATHW